MIKNLTWVTSDNWVSYEDLLECVKNNDLSNATISHALSQHKKDETKYGLLFLNLRDRSSQHLMSKIQHRYQMSEDTYPLYIIDSFENPELFGTFNVKIAPTLIVSHLKFFVTKDYLPSIYSELRV
jgi:hypothetical protein